MALAMGAASSSRSIASSSLASCSALEGLEMSRPSPIDDQQHRIGQLRR